MYSIATYRTSTDKKAEALSSKDFFQKGEEYIWYWRGVIEAKKGNLYCGCCGQPLIISGGGEGYHKQTPHFRHKFKNADENCCYKDDERCLSKRQIELNKYANEEESELHKQLKYLIANILENYGAELRVEQYIRDETNRYSYRRPDIRAIFPDKDIAVEIQRTSTFPSVIYGREEFYSSHKMFLIWILVKFRPDLFYQKDIFYSSKKNAFVLDDEARKLTEQEGKLYLKCYHKSSYCDENGIIKKTDYISELITFDELIYNTDDYSVYYFDVDENRRQCEIENNIILKEQEQKKQEAARQQQIEYMNWLEEQERLQKEAEKQRQKLEDERKEQERVSNIKDAQRLKLEDYVYNNSISLDDYWRYYLQLNEEERQYADDQIHETIMKHVCRQYSSYLPNTGSFKLNYGNAINLYDFLLLHNYPFDWPLLETIPEKFFKQRDYCLNKTLYLKITFDLYTLRDFYMPNWGTHLVDIQQYFDGIMEAAINNENPYYADSDYDIKILLLCYEQLNNSAYAHNREIYQLVFDNIEVIRRLYAIYYGELLGKDYDPKRYYDSLSLSGKFASPYFHLYNDMAKSRKGIFQYGLVPSLLSKSNQTEIEKKMTNMGIVRKQDLDPLMSILFPSESGIQWELQQSLF